MIRQVDKIFGQAVAFLDRSRRVGWVDLALIAGLGGTIYGLVHLSRQWTGALRPAVEIDLSLSALPAYTLLSLSRGLVAYLLSLLFTLGYGYWAAHDRLAERVLIPALDILQSIPVLGFMPGVVLGLVGLFPHSNIGLELASVIMIFTGQAWNMTFSFYHSLRSLPRDLSEVATLNRFGWWQRFRWVELPFSAIGLIWNSMMSMAGGWFFLMVSEAFVLGDKDFRLPGLGSYMSVAVSRGDGRAMLGAVLAMVLMIVVLDQLLWRPVVVWSQKFRVEESGQTETMTSWFLELLQRSRLVAGAGSTLRRLTRTRSPRPPRPSRPPAASRPAGRGPGAAVSMVLFLAVVALLGWGTVDLVGLLRHVPRATWGGISLEATLTLFRVLAATVLGTLWTLPAGLAIGLSPRLSRILQPVVQVVASFPAPMLFPAAVAVLTALGVGLDLGSVVLMLLGTQWYILFNVIAGATAIPADLREAARIYRIGTWQRFRELYLPSVFPYLVTGWVTAAGGAWNASIVSEYMSFRGQVITATGLGARISIAAGNAEFGVLAAAIAVMAAMVALFNRLVWRRLNAVAEARFSLSPASEDPMVEATATAMSDGEALCELRRVDKEFPQAGGLPLRVLQDINIAIRPNEVMALLGPSGCGKSTILRILAGLTKPSGGEVRYHAAPLVGLNPGIGFVFQSFALYPWMTVTQNVAAVLKAKGLPSEEVAGRAARAIRMVGLAGFEEAYPRQLSGGMKQRVGMARAFSLDPEMLFMDEPFSQVDALTAESLRAEVLDLWTAKDKNPSSIVMVSHDIKEVVFMADRIVLLDANPGRVRTVVENTLPRPRDYRSPGLLHLVDRLHDIITGMEMPDVPVEAAAAPAFEPLPPAGASEILGLLEYLDARGGQEDVFRIGSDTDQEFGKLMGVVNAAELLDLVDTPRRLVVLSPRGTQLVKASAVERQSLWREAILGLRLFQVVRDAMERQERHQVDRDFVLEIVAVNAPNEDYERMFGTFVNWARYGGLFDYDEASERLSAA